MSQKKSQMLMCQIELLQRRVAELEETLRKLTIENESNMELARRLNSEYSSVVTLEYLKDLIVSRIPNDEDSLIKIRATVCHFVWAIMQAKKPATAAS